MHYGSCWIRPAGVFLWDETLGYSTENFGHRIREMSEHTGWKTKTGTIELGEIPLTMGILNVTPDSFSDGGQYLDLRKAVERALQMKQEGADILDIGGESSRPGSKPVSVDEELRRVLPIVEKLAERLDIPISIDTTKAEVARKSLEAGAAIVNDISGLTFDPSMPEVCAELRAGVVVMHMQGNPQTMQENPHYDEVVKEIGLFFAERKATLTAKGIAEESIVFDPGIGFGKTAEHNLEILSHIARLKEFGRPILVGHSRKRFLEKVLGGDRDEKLFGTMGVSIALAEQGVDILRVHDVRVMKDAIAAWNAVRSRAGIEKTNPRNL